MTDNQSKLSPWNWMCVRKASLSQWQFYRLSVVWSKLRAHQALGCLAGTVVLARCDLRGLKRGENEVIWCIRVALQMRPIKPCHLTLGLGRGEEEKNQVQKQEKSDRREFAQCVNGGSQCFLFSACNWIPFGKPTAMSGGKEHTCYTCQFYLYVWSRSL